MIIELGILNQLARRTIQLYADGETYGVQGLAVSLDTQPLFSAPMVEQAALDALIERDLDDAAFAAVASMIRDDFQSHGLASGDDDRSLIVRAVTALALLDTTTANRQASRLRVVKLRQ